MYVGDVSSMMLQRLRAAVHLVQMRKCELFGCSLWLPVLIAIQLALIVVFVVEYDDIFPTRLAA